MTELYKRNMTMDFGMELVNLNKTVAQQETIIDELMLKAAMYKANFFHKYDLADKLQEQIKENYDNLTGDWDGFCFVSWRADAVYRNLDDMLRKGLITEEERRFCNVL